MKKKAVMVSSVCALTVLAFFSIVSTTDVKASEQDPTWTHIFNGEDFPCYRVPSNCLMDWPPAPPKEN